MRKYFIIMVVVVFIVGGLFMAAKARTPRPATPTTEQIWADKGVPVQTAVLQSGDMNRSVEVTGDIEALKDIILSSKISGRVTAVYAREGDTVSAGQTVVVLDQQDALANLRSAMGGLESARARLSQARTSSKVTKIQTDSTIEQAQATLAAAQARLEVVKKPTRSQDRMVAENRVASAKANLDNAEANYKRHQMLLKEGAIAESIFDVAKTQYSIAQADYKSAVEQLSLVDEGGRNEDIQAAQSQVDVARQQLRAANANASQNLLRHEDIKSAEAGIKQAQSVVQLAKQQLDNTYVRSPLNGRMASRTVEPGQVVSPGQALGRIVNMGSLYFKGDVSEIEISSISINQPVTVKIDAFAGKTFSGKVTEIFPSGSSASRNFPVRITLSNSNGIKPGMFATGNILVGSVKNILLVPKDAIDSRKGTDSVFTVESDGTVKRHIVSVLAEDRNFVQIQSPNDLQVGQTVVTQGRQNLQDGVKVEKNEGGSRS